MEKAMTHKRIVASVLAVVAVSALATAFAQRASVQGPRHGTGNFQAATKIEHHGNSAQTMLDLHVVGLQSSLLNSTTDARARTQVIMVCNYYVLGTMTPAQQQDYKTDVLQVEKYRPGGDWHKALAAPTMLRELLDVPAGQEAKLAAIMRESDEEVSAIISKPNFRSLTNQQRSALLSASRKAVTTKVANALTASQRAEWNSFVQAAERDLNQAARGVDVIGSK
jgi:hypothetical protein